MSKTNELVTEIRESLSQKSSSRKDEVTVMQTMLNDRDYVVGVYNSSGKIGEYSPAEDSRTMVKSIITNTTGISSAEAETLANDFNFSKNDATTMVGISKEFINTYAETTRKLPLGGRETSNVTLQGVHVNASTTRYPKKIGINDDGSAIYESTVKEVPEHDKIKASAPCPNWIK